MIWGREKELDRVHKVGGILFPADFLLLGSSGFEAVGGYIPLGFSFSLSGSLFFPRGEIWSWEEGLFFSVSLVD